jgi:enoyl-CoA hydratase/carnithine racemase
VLLNQLAAGAAPAAAAASAAGAEAYERAWASADAVEGIAAFRERRRPNFEGG